MPSMELSALQTNLQYSFVATKDIECWKQPLRGSSALDSLIDNMKLFEGSIKRVAHTVQEPFSLLCLVKVFMSNVLKNACVLNMCSVFRVNKYFLFLFHKSSQLSFANHRACLFANLSSQHHLLKWAFSFNLYYNNAVTLAFTLHERM